MNSYNIKTSQPSDGKSNQKSISVASILTPVESDAYFEDIEDIIVKDAESLLVRKPQFRINENSRRRFY
jgi:hypothetical protein